MDEGDGDWQTRHDSLLAEQRPRGLGLIYHYTPVDAALSILRHREVWLSSAWTMNDHSEGRWLEQLLLAHEHERALSTGRGRSLDESRTMNLLWQLVFRSRAPQAYLACFSGAGDVLSQWRAYADDGLGVAIGFDPNEGRMPVVQGPPHSNVASDFACTLSEVHYLDDSTASDLIDVFDLALDSGPESPTFFNAQLALSAERWRTKNPAFMEEREWRIINLPMEFDGDIGGGNTTISTVGKREFRSSGGRLISYFRLPFRAVAVREIVLGPRSVMEERELALFLHQHDLRDVHVVRSAATYRR